MTGVDKLSDSMIVIGWLTSILSSHWLKLAKRQPFFSMKYCYTGLLLYLGRLETIDLVFKGVLPSSILNNSEEQLFFTILPYL